MIDNNINNSSNWIYFAEGGRHIICRDNRINNDDSNNICRYLLRLRKIENDTNDNEDDDDRKRILNNIRYTDDVISNWFGINNNNNSSNHRHVIEMSPSFKSDLLLAISDYRPVGRKSSNSSVDICKYGTLEIDYSYLYKPVHINKNIDDANDISVELKIKCGQKSSSPFLPCTTTTTATTTPPNNHDIKLRYNRYALMQLVKFAKKMNNGTNPWENTTTITTDFKPSSYNPSDIW